MSIDMNNAERVMDTIHNIVHLQNAVTLNQRYPKVLDERIYISNKSVAWIETSIDVACTIGQSLGYDADKIRKTCSKMSELVKPSKIHRNVICHGHLWKNNLMFAEGTANIILYVSVNIGKKQLEIASMEDVVTSDDVKIVAKAYKGDELVQVLDYLVDEYSEEKLGFLGVHKSLKVTLQGSNENHAENVDFFVKLIPHDSKLAADLLNSGIFFKESNFLKNVLPHLEKYCKSEKWCPTCYLAKEDVIIAEDLRAKGYKLHNQIFDDLVALKSVLASLARFHSSSILTEAHLSRQFKKPMRLDEYYQGAFDEKTFVRTGPVARWLSACYDLTCALAKNMGHNSDKIQRAYDLMYHIVQPSNTHQNVICHGDLWNNNFMFADGSSFQKCILIDFQLIRYAPLVTDLLQVMYLNATRSFRRKHERDLMEFYHSILQETVQSNDMMNSIRVPTLTEILEGMDNSRLFGLVMASLALPIILIDSKTAMTHTEDPESYEKFTYGDRFAITLAHMKENAFHKTIVEEVIAELVEKSEELFN